MNAARTVVRPVALLVAFLFVAGCAQTDRSCPVTGRVSVNGKPAAGLYLVFTFADGKGRQNPATARTEKDGSFSLRVPESGEYAITAFWPKQIVEQGGTVEGEDAFKGRFRDPLQPASKVTITTGENALPPLDLKFKFAKP